jgi:imidazolonepropionase
MMDLKCLVAESAFISRSRAKATGTVCIDPDTGIIVANGATDLDSFLTTGDRLVTPGLVDSHTHLVFAGDRADEFYRRARGDTYADIAREGGGILRTMTATRAASEDELFELGRARLVRLLDAGTTTVEVKSGYGLTDKDELKQLRAIRRLAADFPGQVVATYMGAHAVPPEWKGRAGGYLKRCSELIATIAADGLAEFVDIFVDPLAFSRDDCDCVVQATFDAGLKLKLHGDEFGDDGTAAWGAGLGATSIDHLGGISPDGIDALAGSATVATLLPGTMFFSAHGRFAPARAMLDSGCTVALATDLNPGSSHVYSLPLVMTLAALRMGMTAQECLDACTVNGAKALGKQHLVGALDPGMRADIVVWDCTRLDELPYHAGANLARDVIAGGKVVKRDGVWLGW